MLAARAFRLARAAQAVRLAPVPDVAERLARMRGWPRPSAPDAAMVAAARACSRLARWGGGLDTCLVRSLVAGALLADRARVILHIGFRPAAAAGGPADGHAWLTVDARENPDGRPRSGRSRARRVRVRRDARRADGAEEELNVHDLARIGALLQSDRLTRTALADGSGVILDVDGMSVLSLNGTGQFIVAALAEGMDDRRDLVRRIVAEFEVDEDTAAADLDEFLNELTGVLGDPSIATS